MRFSDRIPVDEFNQVVVVESASGTLNLTYEGETLGSVTVNYTRPT